MDKIISSDPNLGINFSKANPYPLNNANQLQSRYIIINSVDRDWYSQLNETPSNFTLKLGSGFDSSDNCNISEVLKNVVSLKIDKLILPNRKIYNTYSSNSYTRFSDEAFLTIRFNGINNTDYGTNEITNHAIAIMTPLIPLPTSFSDISYLEYKNSNNQSKNYIGTPKSIIDRFDINITNPLGIENNPFNDIQTINRIFSTYSNSSVPLSNSSIIIQTNNYFTETEFVNGDLIKIKGYIFRNNTNNECFLFNNYINNEQGHRVIGIGKSGLTELYNQILIPTPQYLSRTTGDLIYENWYSDFLLKNNFTSATGDSGGKLINTNLQTHLLVSAICIPNSNYNHNYQNINILQEPNISKYHNMPSQTFINNSTKNNYNPIIQNKNIMKNNFK